MKEQVQKSWLQPSISVGNIIQVIVLIVAVVGSHYHQEVQMAEIKGKISVIESQFQSYQADIDRRFGRLNNDVFSRLDRLEDKIDRLIEAR